MRYNFTKVEKKWQKKWEDKNIFEVKDKGAKKYYVLEMFPYPSSSGLHIGHALNYTIGDIFARFKRMKGFNVLYPMGYDALGLPAENAAIKAGEHPKKYTLNSIKNFVNQQKCLGLSYDWSRMINTFDSDYYKWDQWIFLKMFEKGIAYRKKAPVNWCSKCNSVLANEQVHNGRCWRHSKCDVEIKYLEQWFFKITDYADELLDNVDKLDWPERIKSMQKNWIGKSYGTEIMFKINEEDWPVFTTRADTIYGVTFMVVSTQHLRLMELVTKEQKKDVEKFLKRIKSVSDKDLEELDKEGVFTGSYAVNPLTKDKIPVYVGNFVVADYGSGMVMAVPAHDQRDFLFAKKYGIDVKVVIQPEDYELNSEKMSRAFTGNGKLVNSSDFDNLNNREAIQNITKYLVNKKLGKKSVQYKLKDWLVSRQRYWGTPIPIIYCEKCGIVPVKEKDLPVLLPEKVKFGKGNPLLTSDKFVNVKCFKCGGKAKRETDTMDTFVNSSWYFLRYCDSKNNKKIFDNKKVKYWCPVDKYIGGAEHACMHLIYFRFYNKFLRDIGMLDFDEPAKSLFNQGMLHGADGNKMSKSLGNVINPIEIIERYGADSLRLALMSFASPDKDTSWDEKVLVGSNKFLNKVYDYFDNVKVGKSDFKIESKLNKTIKDVSELIEGFKYNLAIIKIRDLFDSFSDGESLIVLRNFLKLLHLFCPHITEELWEKINGKEFISLEKWPVVDEKKIDESFEKQEEAIDKLVSDIIHVVKLVKNGHCSTYSKLQNKGAKVFVYVLPNEFDIYFSELDVLKERIGLEISVFAVNDKKKYDPSGKSKKAKPGKPAIYLE